LSPASLAAQEPSWMATPGSDPIAMRMSPPQGQVGPVRGKPFTATEIRRTVQVLGDGSHLDQSETGSFARDEYGRMRTGNAKTVVIFDPLAGFTYTLDMPSRTYYKMPLSGYETTYSIAVTGNRVSTSSVSVAGTAPSQVNVSASGAQIEEELPALLMNGLLAKGSRVTITIPAGTIGNDRDLRVVNERWYSEDLQVLLRSSNTDPRFGSTTYALTDLVQASPDPLQFQVPGDFRVRAAHWKH
jgi:hypothetical protein